MSSEPRIPSHWSWTTVGDLAPLVQFGTSARCTEDSNGIPVLRMGNIANGALDLAKLKFLPKKHPDAASLTLAPGDILFNRTNSAELVGKTAVYSGTPRQCSFASYLIRVRVSDGYNPHLLAAYLNSPFGRAWAQSVATQQVGQANVNGTKLKALRVPLPPRDEQDRIVAEIEKQFTRLDAGVEALKRLQAHLRRYRAAVLKAAVEGKLVPTEAARARAERRDFEPAATLLARIEAPPRPNRWGSRSKDVALGHAALAVGNPGTDLPEGWAWSALVDIARMESGHTPSREHPEWWGGNVPWIGIADAREHDGGTIHDTLQHTNSAGLDNSAARLLPAGTVCVSRTASVGYVVVTGRAMATSQDFVNWIPTGAVSPDWLRLVFSSDREALRRFGKGSVHKTIYFPEWLSVHVAVPPLAEQGRIVAETDRLLSVAGDSAKLVDAWIGRSLRLRHSILKHAFEGKLTSQALP